MRSMSLISTRAAATSSESEKERLPPGINGPGQCRNVEWGQKPITSHYKRHETNMREGERLEKRNRSLGRLGLGFVAIIFLIIYCLSRGLLKSVSVQSPLGSLVVSYHRVWIGGRVQPQMGEEAWH